MLEGDNSLKVTSFFQGSLLRKKRNFSHRHSGGSFLLLITGAFSYCMTRCSWTGGTTGTDAIKTNAAGIGTAGLPCSMLTIHCSIDTFEYC